MRAGIGAGVEIYQTAGDMRAERAECGSMGLGRSRGGEGDMRADGARRDSAGLYERYDAYREEMLRCGQLSSAGRKDCRHLVVLIFDVC